MLLHGDKLCCCMETNCVVAWRQTVSLHGVQLCYCMETNFVVTWSPTVLLLFTVPDSAWGLWDRSTPPAVPYEVWAQSCVGYEEHYVE